MLMYTMEYSYPSRVRRVSGRRSAYFSNRIHDDINTCSQPVWQEVYRSPRCKIETRDADALRTTLRDLGAIREGILAGNTSRMTLSEVDKLIDNIYDYLDNRSAEE